MGEENMSFPGCGPGAGESFMPRNLFIDSFLPRDVHVSELLLELLLLVVFSTARYLIYPVLLRPGLLRGGCRWAIGIPHPRPRRRPTSAITIKLPRPRPRPRPRARPRPRRRPPSADCDHDFGFRPRPRLRLPTTTADCDRDHDHSCDHSCDYTSGPRLRLRRGEAGAIASVRC